MKIKKGYTAEIISGKYKGSKGKIISICEKTSTVKIENINMKIKHIKPQQSDEKGSIKEIEGPIHQSNIKIKN
uniref:Large ribosomal subunit protein uL24c n=1 Tax=Melanothamnus harveyi TaxID=397005 RepID=A0A1Z1MI82_MELHR|nr:ribosomal protein L24 [Melanothamnus harveyi]ARW65444.1 ribosomal protein L24 [Melanothamnus harveyi]